MKRVLIYVMIASVTFAAAGGSTMFLLKKNDSQKHNTNAPTIEEDYDEDEEIEEEPATNQELFMASIIDNNLNVKNLDAVVYNLEEGQDLALNFKGAFDYKGLQLATKNFSEFRIQGDLSAKYKDIDETLNLTFLPGNFDILNQQNGLTNGKLFFGYSGRHYSINVNTIPEILETLKVFNIPVDNIRKEETTPSEGSTKLDPLAILSTMKETATETGFDYTVTLPNDIGTVVLESDKQNELSGIRTEGNLKVGGMEIKLDADVQTGENSFVKNPGDVQEIDNVTGIFNTVASIYTSKQLSANYSLKFNDTTAATNETIKLNGKLGLDLSKSTNPLSSLNKDDLLNGKYFISVDPDEENSNKLNAVNALYSGSNIYLKVNELLKAKIDDAMVSDVTKFINQANTQMPDLSGALDQINNIIVGTKVDELMKGNFLAIKDIVKNVIITDTRFEFVFNPASLGLNGPELKIILTLKDNSLSSLTIEGLSYKNYLLDFDLKLTDFVNLESYVNDPSNYVSYSGAFNIYNSLSKVINAKKLDTTYDISLIDTNSKEQYLFQGDMKANLNSVDFNDLNTLINGEYEINLATNYAGLERNIKAINKNNNVYLKYNDLISNRANHASINDIFSVIDKLMANPNEENTVKPSDVFKQINFTMADVKKLIDPILNELKNGNIDILAKYANISVEEVFDESSNLTNKYFDIRIYPNGDALAENDRLIIHAVLDSVTNKIAKIDLSNLKFDNFILNCNLNVNLEPQDIVLNEKEYAPIDNLFYGVSKLIADKRFNATVDASIVNTASPEVNPITLGAIANVDVNTHEVYGQLDITGQTVKDKRDITHRVYVDYDDLENNLDSELLARYCNVENGVESSGMFINMNESKIISLINRVNDMPDNNVLRRLLNIVKQTHTVLPIETILQNKDYLTLFDEYLKGFKITVTESELGPQFDKINVVIDKALLGLETDLDITLVASYETKTLTKLEIKNLQINGKTVDLTANLDEFDTDNLEKMRLKTTHPKESTNYFDFNNLDLLFELGINTTNTNVYHLNGTLDLTLTDGLTDLYDPHYEIDIRVEVQDNGKVKGYILVYYQHSTEYSEAQISILENDDVIINYRYKLDGWLPSYVHYVMKITPEEFQKGFTYYMFYVVLAFPDIAIKAIDKVLVEDKTVDSNPDTALQIKYDQIFTKMENHSKDGNKSGQLCSTIDISKIANIGLELGKVDINLNYNSNENGVKGLSSLQIKSEKIVVIGIWSIGINLNLNNLAVNEPMSSFFKVRDDNIAYWNRRAPGQYSHTERQGRGNYKLVNASDLKWKNWDLSKL